MENPVLCRDIGSNREAFDRFPAQYSFLGVVANQLPLFQVGVASIP